MSYIPGSVAKPNPKSLGELFTRHHRGVVGQCRHMLRSPEEAEDAASEVFARLPCALQTYNNAMPFSRWLTRVVGNHCLDLLRRRRSEERLLMAANSDAHDSQPSELTPLQVLLNKERSGRVRSAIGRLPRVHRVALVLRYYRDLSYDEIAAQLGLNRAHVAVLIHRAKEQLRRMLSRTGRMARSRRHHATGVLYHS